MNLIGRRVLFSGNVQGVGFRFTCLETAKHHAVAGWVRNLSDGRVETQVKGTRVAVDGFIVDLTRHTRLAGLIAKCDFNDVACQSVEPDDQFVIRR